MPSPCLVVLTTLPTRAQALEISRLLLKEKLAACVNLLGPIDSSYWWKGKTERAKEVLILIKTPSSRFNRLRRFLEKNHPYSVPEIIAWPIQRGNAPYLDWIRESTKFSKERRR